VQPHLLSKQSPSPLPLKRQPVVTNF
jgi:hypothetical protein